jgi:hypothetical protein
LTALFTVNGYEGSLGVKAQHLLLCGTAAQAHAESYASSCQELPGFLPILSDTAAVVSGAVSACVACRGYEPNQALHMPVMTSGLVPASIATHCYDTRYHNVL